MESKCIPLVPVEKYNLYPYLGIFLKCIVLFTAKNTGTIVFTDKEKERVGEYITYWDEDTFEPYTGKVELSN
jgi:hypothetical protein